MNNYLREITGEEITAKDFRIRAATNLAALALPDCEGFDCEAKAKTDVLRAVEAVVKLLGNAPRICSTCYIHPAIFEGYPDGSLPEGLKARADAVLTEAATGLTAEEVGIGAYLNRRLGRLHPSNLVCTYHTRNARGALANDLLHILIPWT